MPFDQRGGDQAGAGGDIEHPVRRPERNSSDQGSAPARVLAKAEERTRGVVLGRDAGEELERAP
jgi:hypothetical protein